MSVQRRRGQLCKIYPQRSVIDDEGNESQAPDWDNPYEIRAAFIPNRGSRGEVPGQLAINVFSMIFEPDLPNVGLWSIVEWDGKFWDPVTPPQHHFGTRRTRHWTMEIRERPSSG